MPDSDGGKNAARENAADKNAPAETAAVPGFQEKDRTWN